MEAGPVQQGLGYIPYKLESNLRLRFSPFCSNRESTAERSARASFHDLNNSSIANTVMALRVTSWPSVRTPLQHPETKKYFERSRKELTSIASAKFSNISGVDHLRKNIQTEGVTKRASDFITNSRRTGSFKHYESAWGKWVS